MDAADADRLLDFVDRSQVIARNAVWVTGKAGGTPREHADRLLGHWRREFVRWSPSLLRAVRCAHRFRI